MDIISRLNTYNTGRIDDVDLKYYALVKNGKPIEKCIHKYLEKYEINIERLLKTIDLCYIENVSEKEHKKLLEDVSTILGFCDKTLKNKNYKPYMIIGTDLKTK